MRILVFLHPGTNSRAIFDDLLRGLTQAGHTLIPMDLGPLWARLEAPPAARTTLLVAAGKQVMATIARERVDFSVAMWANAVSTFPAAPGGPGARGPQSFFEAAGPGGTPHRHLMYWLDAPQWAHGGAAVDWSRTGLFGGEALRSVVNNGATAEEMRAVLGFRHAAGLAYGVDLDAFRPRGDVAPARRREFDVAFVVGAGDPAPTASMLAALRSDDPPVEAIRAELAERALGEVARLLEPALGAAEGAKAARLLVDGQLRSRSTPMLTRVRALEGAAAGLLADAGLYVRVSGVLRGVDAWHRAFVVAWLARRFRVLLMGQADLGAWGVEATRLGFGDPAAQATAYAQARLGLNVMRWQDDVGVNLKPLEIAGAGVACLCARRVGLEAILEDGAEVLAFDTPAQAAALVRRAAAEPEWCDEVGRAALARAARDHTWRHRAADLVAIATGGPG